MRRGLVSIVVFIVLFATGWWLLEGQPPVSRDSDTNTVTDSSPQEPPSDGAAAARTPLNPALAADEATSRVVMRRRILDALHAREQAARDDDERAASDRTTRSEPGPHARAEQEEEPSPTGGLMDRTGDHEYLVRVMNEELMPLVDECVEQALELQPRLEGMLIVDLEIIAEPEIGGVVESVDMGRDNEVVAPDLTECVRESILATTLPAPKQGGRDEISISLPLTPNEAPNEPAAADVTG